MFNVTNDIIYVGVNDHQVDLFEGQYKVKNGMSYNSYVIMDEKIAIMDTVDKNFTHEWLDNIAKALKGRVPSYLIVQHMEPDHSANIMNFLNIYENVTVVASKKAFTMMENFFHKEISNKVIISEDDTLNLGKHTLAFKEAPMVHWPEVMVTYDTYDKVLFSADGFGKFGALDVNEEWIDEARRYYIGIVGKYGAQVQALLKKAATLDISIIAPLHGPILNENLSYYLNCYNKWSSYESESNGILICYTSVYGHTKKAVEVLKEKLKNNGAKDVLCYDLARCDMSEAVAMAFKYHNIILATTTYNADVFPFMKEFINHLLERNFQNKRIALIENGSWAPMAYKVMKEMFSESKNITYTNKVTIKSSLDDLANTEIDLLVNDLTREYRELNNETANKNDMSALFKIGYGLYVVTSNDGTRDNGLIVNTVTQVTNTPNRIAVCINKQNYSHHIIKQTGIMNVNCLSIDAPFSIFEAFGFRSGRTVDKFSGMNISHSDNGLPFLNQYINAFMSLKVEQYVDLDTHGMFICSVTEARVINNRDTMTYTYYQNNVKPKPKTEGKKGYVCTVCGYVYEGDELPDDYICPLCKHGASDFEPIN